MALSFESTKVNTAKILVDKSSEIASSMSLGEFEALLGGGVLKELDSQISMHKSEIEASNVKKSALRDDITSINKLLAKETSSTVEFWTQQRINDGLEAPIHNETAIPLSKEEKLALNALAGRLGLSEELALNYGYDGNGKLQDGTKTNQRYITKDFLESMKESLENELTDLNSNTEMDSIKFQSLMDARKQSLLMLSNMISSDNQTKMSIINNMK